MPSKNPGPDPVWEEHRMSGVGAKARVATLLAKLSRCRSPTDRKAPWCTDKKIVAPVSWARHCRVTVSGVSSGADQDPGR